MSREEEGVGKRICMREKKQYKQVMTNYSVEAGNASLILITCFSYRLNEQPLVRFFSEHVGPYSA